MPMFLEILIFLMGKTEIFLKKRLNPYKEVSNVINNEEEGSFNGKMLYFMWILSKKREK